MSVWRAKLLPWLNQKIVDPFMQILGRGAEPKLLAFSTALGLTLGIFPICGVTVFLCGLAIILFGNNCHGASVMLANFIATPIELSLVIPFLRLGEFITGGPHFSLTSDAFKKVLTGHASRELLLSIAHALLGWIIAAPFVLALLYAIFVPTFNYLVRKFGSSPSSPEKHLLIKPKVKGARASLTDRRLLRFKPEMERWSEVKHLVLAKPVVGIGSSKVTYAQLSQEWRRMRTRYEHQEMSKYASTAGG